MTLKDVALISGCSVATVSKVFKNSIEISDETKKRVLAAAKSCGYLEKATSRTAVLGGMMPVLVNGDITDLMVIQKIFKNIQKAKMTPVFCTLNEGSAIKLAGQIGALGIVVLKKAESTNDSLFYYFGNDAELGKFLKTISQKKTARPKRKAEPLKKQKQNNVVTAGDNSKTKNEEIWLL